MIIRIVKIGNSQGIRIPKILLEQSGLTKEVELEVQDNKIIISPINDIRTGWDEAFRIMAENNDDHLLDEENLINQSSWDTEEWDW